MTCGLYATTAWLGVDPAVEGLHQERGVLDHLPEREHGWVRGKLRRAWANPDADEATRDLEALARQLEKLNPDAAGSLREGLAEMFDVWQRAQRCRAGRAPDRWSARRRREEPNRSRLCRRSVARNSSQRTVPVLRRPM